MGSHVPCLEEARGADWRIAVNKVVYSFTVIRQTATKNRKFLVGFLTQ